MLTRRHSNRSAEQAPSAPPGRSYQANRAVIALRMSSAAEQLAGGARGARRARWDFQSAAVNFVGRGGWGHYAVMRDAAARWVQEATGTSIHPGDIEPDREGLPIRPGDEHLDGQPPEVYTDREREERRDRLARAAVAADAEAGG